MAKKVVRFNKEGIEKLPEDKPVVYKIVTKGGANNYTGVAKRGRVQDTLSRHLPDGPDPIPGSTIVIEQMDNVAVAREKETSMLKRLQPKYNKHGRGTLFSRVA